MKKVKYFIILLILIVVYFLINKNFHIRIPCVFYKITGMYCPGCGITRMIFSLFRLEIYQAFRYNPLIFIMGVVYLIYCFLKLLGQKIIIGKYSQYAMIVILLLYGILRNISLFEFLQPTIINSGGL